MLAPGAPVYAAAQTGHRQAMRPARSPAGQPATPTRLGKEMMVFVERLNNQVAMLERIPYGAKFGGPSSPPPQPVHVTL